MTLTELNEAMRRCVACDLSATRTQVVVGSGSASARLMVLGEAPGAKEDETGVPFVGRSGQLLDRLLGEIELARSEVFVTNVVKCRPPDNRDPRPVEIGACSPFLERQLALVDPSVVVTLGNFAARRLLDTKEGITRLRGKSYPWAGREVVPTFHPAAALRGGQKVLDAMREDLALAKQLSERA